MNDDHIITGRVAFQPDVGLSVGEGARSDRDRLGTNQSSDFSPSALDEGPGIIFMAYTP